MSAGYYFAIVAGQSDTPIYEQDFRSKSKSGERKGDTQRSLPLFLMHAALDAVDELVWERSELHMKHIDRFNTWIVTAYVTPSRVRLMLLHDVRNDDGIKTFLTEVHQLYVKTLLNPFYKPGAPITSRAFATKVKSLAKKHLA